MPRVRLDDDVLNAAWEALEELRDESKTRIDTNLSTEQDGVALPDVTLTAYWVGDIARVDVKRAREKR